MFVFLCQFLQDSFLKHIVCVNSYVNYKISKDLATQVVCLQGYIFLSICYNGTQLKYYVNLSFLSSWILTLHGLHVACKIDQSKGQAIA